jgi:hypothetical protein
MTGLDPADLYAWVGEDELGSGTVGLKQGAVPAGIIPLVSTADDRHKITRPDLIAQLQRQADHYGKSIRLVRYVYAEEVLEILPARRS